MGRYLLNNRQISRLMVYAVLAVTIGVLYCDTIDNFYVADDYNRIPCLLENQDKILSLFWSEGCDPGVHFRPITYTVQSLSVKFLGLNYRFHHVLLMMLHFLCAVVVFEVALRLVLQTRRSSIVVAMFAGLIFAVHPRHLEPVTLVCASENQICAFFYFLGILSFIRYSQSERTHFLLISTVCYLGSLLAKESGITLPLVCGAYYLIFHCRAASIRCFYKREVVYKAAALFSLAVIFYFLMRLNAFGSLLGHSVNPVQLQYSVLLTLKGLIQHIAAMSIPNNIPGLNWAEMYFRERPVGAIVLMAIIAITSVIGMSKSHFWRSRLCLFGAVWAIVGVLLTLNFGIAVSTPTSGRWLYMALGGFSIGLAGLLMEIKNRYLAILSASFAVVLFSYCTLMNNQAGKVSAQIAENFLKGFDEIIDNIENKNIAIIVPYLYDGIYTLNSAEDGLLLLYGDRGERFVRANDITVQFIDIKNLEDSDLILERGGERTEIWFEGDVYFIAESGFSSANDSFADITKVSSKGTFIAKKLRLGSKIDLLVAPNLDSASSGVITFRL